MDSEGRPPNNGYATLKGIHPACGPVTSHMDTCLLLASYCVFFYVNCQGATGSFEHPCFQERLASIAKRRVEQDNIDVVPLPLPMWQPLFQFLLPPFCGVFLYSTPPLWLYLVHCTQQRAEQCCGCVRRAQPVNRVGENGGYPPAAAPGRSWLAPHILVRIVDKKLRAGRWLLKSLFNFLCMAHYWYLF